MEPVVGHQLGRYVLYDEIASGGMASVHFGRMLGPAGFSRTVAIKRLHAHLARDPQFVSMFLDEARVAARVQHPNVVSTIDVVAREGELFLVMEYVNSESLSTLLREARARGVRVPPHVVSSIISGVLHGLHAAHEAKSEQGEPLQIVHRDVSPQNIIVGIDGVARVLDFGVAKATMRVQLTRSGEVKGKFAYMAPEQLESRKIDRRTDLYAASVVLWEALASKRLFSGDDPGAIVTRVLLTKVPSLAAIVPDLPPRLHALVQRGLARDAAHRFPTALEMALELEACLPAAPQHAVGDWVKSCAPERLEERSRRLARIERTPAEEPSVLDTEQADDSNPLLSPAVIRAMSEAHTERAQKPPTDATLLARVGGSREASSAVTELSLVTEPRARRRTRQRQWLLVATTAFIVGAGMLAYKGLNRAPATPAAASIAAAATATAMPDIPVPSVVPTAAEVPHETTLPLNETGGAAAKIAPKTRAAPGKSARNCDPPYTIDASGVKRFKQWCFK